VVLGVLLPVLAVDLGDAGPDCHDGRGSIRSQRSATSSPRRAPLVIASQTNRPHTGSFHASEEMRAAWEADGG
jgi:hypothetical protein